MVRKGQPKVRTGCLTCKTRKVKCDESKPACQRCKSTGRKCDGYPPPQPGALSWDELLVPRTIAPALTTGAVGEEGRALDFFRRVVAPVLSTGGNDYFWKNLVSQVSLQEPVVRHAVIAISSIYEQFGQAPSPVGGQELTPLGSGASPGGWLDSSSRGRFAMGHYNQALRQLTSRPHEERVYLLASILFVCVEVMQGHKSAAIEHTRHGVTILNNTTDGVAWARDYLLPIYARLSVFPFFFGSNPETFPAMSEMGSDLDAPYHTLDEARFALDLLVGRSIRFIRKSDPYTEIGEMRDAPAPEEMVAEQRALEQQLDRWRNAFQDFCARNPCPLDDPGSYLMLEIKVRVVRTWLSARLHKHQGIFDNESSMRAYREILDFAKIIISSEEGGASSSSAAGEKPKFFFEIGYMPMLYWYVITCRDLDLRLQALEAMLLLSANHESLWDSAILYSVACRLIEKEHAVKMVEGRAVRTPKSVLVPPDSMRVRDSMISEEMHFQRADEGRELMRRKVYFIGVDAEEKAKIEEEWVPITMGGPTRSGSDRWHIPHKVDAAFEGQLKNLVDQIQSFSVAPSTVSSWRGDLYSTGG